MPTRPVTHWLPDNSGLTALYVSAKSWGTFDIYHHAWGCFTEDGRLIGGIVIFNWDEVNSYAAIALDGGAMPSRAFMRELARFVADNIGSRRMTFECRASNAPAHKIARLLGARHEGTLRARLPDGDDVLIFGVQKSECPFLTRGNHGRQRSSTQS